MSDAEYVLRFLTLNDTWRNFTGNLRRSMDKFMKDHRAASEHEVAHWRDIFERSIQACRQLWGDLAFKRPAADAWRHQMLAGMYDAQMLAVAQLTEEQIASLANQSARVVEETRLLFNSDEEFEESVRRATNTPSRIVYRVNKIMDTLASIA
jgi:uncharacterized protein YaeQ